MPPTPIPLTGLPDGAVDGEKHEILFDLQAANGETWHFVVGYEQAIQITGALVLMQMKLRQILEASKDVVIVDPFRVAAAHIQQDRGNDLVLMELMTPEGTPFAFGFPRQLAADIASRLKIESEKPTEM